MIYNWHSQKENTITDSLGGEMPHQCVDNLLYSSSVGGMQNPLNNPMSIECPFRSFKYSSRSSDPSGGSSPYQFISQQPLRWPFVHLHPTRGPARTSSISNGGTSRENTSMP